VSAIVLIFYFVSHEYSVDQVVEKMFQLYLKEVSLEKMLIGLELVLRKA